MFCDGLVVLALEENLLRVFFVVSLPSSQAFDQDVALLVLLNSELVSVILIQQVNESFIVELEIRNRHFDLVLVS